jgi:hypothetical protein
VFGGRSAMNVVGFSIPIGVAVALLASSLTVSAGVPLSSLGAWSDPVEIFASEAALFANWSTTIYGRYNSGVLLSSDLGDTWQTGGVFVGTIAIDDFVLYRANLSGTFGPEIFYSKSLDNGSTWSPVVEVMAPDGNDGAYRIFKFGSTLIVYSYYLAGTSDGYILMSRSTDGGSTWSPEIVIDPNVHVEDPGSPDMVMVGSTLYLAYSNYTDVPIVDSKIIVSSSDDMGLTWTQRTEVSSGTYPVLKANNGILYLAYIDLKGSNYGLYFTKSSNGVDWSTPEVVGPMTDFTGGSFIFSLAVDDLDVFLAYLDFTDNGGVGDLRVVHIVYSSDGGSSWTDLGDVTGGDGDEMYPTMLIASGRLHFAWIDAEGSGGWGGDTYYRHLEIVAEPIPEFGTFLVPVLGTMVAAFLLLLGRRTL